MSIFKQTLTSYVRNQLYRRRAALAFMSDPDSNAYHYATWGIQRQCIIRMSSGVDIEPGTFPPTSENPELIDEPTGTELAEKWILSGDMWDEGDGFSKPVREETIRRKDDKYGFHWKPGEKIKSYEYTDKKGNKGKSNVYEGAYGSTMWRANAGDGYGIVPMPGIVDAQIRTKTAYGSLREAQVNWVCHNRRQLEILEYLYLRPGYTVL